VVGHAAVEVPFVDRFLVGGGVEDRLGSQLVKLEDVAVRSSLVRALLDDAVC